MSEALSGSGILSSRRSLRSKRLRPLKQTSYFISNTPITSNTPIDDDPVEFQEELFTESPFAETVDIEEEVVVETPMRRKTLFHPKKEVIRVPRRTSLFTPMGKQEVKGKIPEVPEVPEVPVQEEIVVPKENLVDVQEELIQLGYAPISKVVVSKEGNLEGKYIKALNLYCQHIYIELDVEGVLAVEEGTIAHLERETVSEIPLNVEMDALRCAESDVCGVAFECKNGVCTLTQEETSTPKRTSFIRVEKNEEIAALMLDDNIAYPVVKFSEIRANPSASLEAQNNATTLLRNKSYDNLVQNLNEMSQYINVLLVEFNTFNASRNSLSAKVHEDLVNLERLKNSYLNTPPLHPEEEREYKATIKAICRRNKIVVDILECAMQVTNNLEILKRMVQNITAAKSECLEHIQMKSM